MPQNWAMLKEAGGSLKKNNKKKIFIIYLFGPLRILEDRNKKAVDIWSLPGQESKAGRGVGELHSWVEVVFAGLCPLCCRHTLVLAYPLVTKRSSVKTISSHQDNPGPRPRS